MTLYDELKRRKSDGEAFDFQDITEDHLMELYRHVSDAQIAELYGVKESQVTEQRRQFGITLRRVALETMMGNPDRNRHSKQRLMELGVNSIAGAVAHFALQRSVPGESNGVESEIDSQLELLVHRRLAYAFGLLCGEHWQEFEFLVQSHSSQEGHSVSVLPDDAGIREAAMKAILETAASKERRR